MEQQQQQQKTKGGSMMMVTGENHEINDKNHLNQINMSLYNFIKKSYRILL